MKLVYVAGPFRGPNTWEVEQNIRRAEILALDVWRLGAAALCPHTNTRFFDGAADDLLWLQGDIVMLSRCDAVIMTPDWRRSNGATAEYEYALHHGIPVFETLDALKSWLDAENEKV